MKEAFFYSAGFFSSRLYPFYEGEIAADRVASGAIVAVLMFFVISASASIWRKDSQQ